MNVNTKTSTASTYGGLLDGLFNQINDTIQDATQGAKNAGIELQIEAGREIGLVIDKTRNYYRSELDYTIGKVKKEAQEALTKLQSIVEKFEKKITDELPDLKREAQQLANTMPFSSKQPQLTSVKPRFLVIDELAKSTLVTFHGNFPYSAKTGFEPIFSFSGNSCFIADKTTQALTFEIPHSPFEGTNPKQFSFKVGDLVVPWDDGIIWSHRTEFNYKVGLGALPQLAGKVTAEYVSHQTVTDRQHTTSQEYFYDGNNWYPEHWHTIYEHIHPTQGWKIDISKKPNLTSHHVHGDHKQEILSYASDEVIVKIELYCKSGDDIGKVKIQVDFDEYKERRVENKRKEQFDINWKNSKLIEPENKDNEEISKVIFDAYDGSQQQFGGPDLDNGVLKVAAEGNGKWKIWAEPPKELTD